MNVSKGSMWNNGEKVRLSHLLDKVPTNEWDWYLYEIEAIGIARETCQCLILSNEFYPRIPDLNYHGMRLKIFPTH